VLHAGLAYRTCLPLPAGHRRAESADSPDAEALASSPPREERETGSALA
jgi:hypothetical protein